MKNYMINIILIGLILIIFTSYFIAIQLTFADNITDQLKLAENYARNEDWNQVLSVAKDLDESWHTYKHLLMFNFAEAEFSVFENHLEYIIGGAEGEQIDTTLSNILTAEDLWKNFRKIVPEP